MPAKYWSGKNGAISLNSVSYAGKRWTLSIETTAVDVTNFNSAAGWREYISGFSKGSFEIECVLDSTLAQITQGAAIAFLATMGTTATVAGNCVVSGYTYGTDVDGNATLKIKAYLTGAPTVTMS